MTAPVLYLCGAGNPDGIRLARAVNQLASRWSAIVLLDDDPARHHTARLGVTVEGPISLLREQSPGRAVALNLVARTTQRRRAVRERIDAAGVPCVTLVAPDVDLDGVTLAGDTLVYPGARLGAEATLARDSCVFPGAVVGHEAIVGPGAVIAPNAVINARVVLGEGAYVGANATILPELRIGAWATVGAGSTVLSDVPDHATVLGVPAEPVAAIPREASVPPALELAAAEQLVVSVWRSVLAVPAIDPHRSFFDLGGDSLLALRARQALQEQSGRDLGPLDLYRYPTARALATHLARAVGPSTAAERGLKRRDALQDRVPRHS